MAPIPLPKRDLIAAAQVALQGQRLKVAADLPNATLLVEELTAYKVNINTNGHDSYGNDWRYAEHDDLVLALAIALHVATRPPTRGPRMVHVSRSSPPAPRPSGIGLLRGA